MEKTLGRRELNRALLSRQLLLKREAGTVLGTIEHLVGLQAQAPFPPYFGLWSRLTGFDPHELGGLLEDRRAARMVLMRGTVHLVSARDALALFPLTRVIMERFLRTTSGHHGVLDRIDDPEELLRAGREALSGGPLSAKELGALLHPRWPREEPADLARVVQLGLPLLQVPPRGVWGKSGQPRLAPAPEWLAGTDDAETTTPERLVLRYLAAFGPASIPDVQAWSGLTRLAPVLEELRPRLVTFRDESGRELFDLPEAPRPGGDVAAPVRYIAEFDNLTLSHADRGRIIDERWRPAIASLNGMIPGMVLIDGFVGGTWKIAKGRGAAVLTVSPFASVSKKNTASLQAEGRRLLAFAAPGAAAHDVRVAPPA